MSIVNKLKRKIGHIELVSNLVDWYKSVRYSYMHPDCYERELSRIYRKKFQSDLDFNNPITYNEKMQWMKLYDNTPIKTQLADKYKMKEFVSSMVGEKYVVPLLGVWDNVDEIDFDSLPDKFVLKTNNSCHTNIIVTDKNKLNRKLVVRKLKRWLCIRAEFLNGFELQYRDIPPKIIAEEYIDCGTIEPDDYKVWCFEGKAHYVQFLTNRSSGLKMDFYDLAWNRMPFNYSYPQCDKPKEKPNNLNEMIEISEKLAQGLHHVRVDFYMLPDSSLKIGELTFTSAGGMCRWQPSEWDAKLGELIKLP